MKLLNAKCMSGPASLTHTYPLPAHPGLDQLQPGAMANLGSQGCFKGSGNSTQASVAACLIPNVYSTSNHWDTSLFCTPHICLWDLTFAALLGLAHLLCIFSCNVRFYLGLYVGPFSSSSNSPTRIPGLALELWALSLHKQTMSGTPLPNAAQLL